MASRGFPHPTLSIFSLWATLRFRYNLVQAIATRHDNRAETFLAAFYMAASIIWLH